MINGKTRSGFHPGLVSVTFRQLAPEAIIDLAVQARIEGIEWGGDVHVPHGDAVRAGEVGRMTREAGLAVASYGSYYRLGESEAAGGDEKLEFARVLETALALEAPTIRVWAGRRASADADTPYRARVAQDFRRVAEMASEAGIAVACEFHGGTLTDTAESARALLEAVGHASARTYWQPPTGLSREEHLAGLRLVRPWLANVHVFQWEGWPPVRQALREGAGEWGQYFLAMHGDAPFAIHSPERWALLEFVERDDPRAFLRDAETLKEWVKG